MKAFCSFCICLAFICITFSAKACDCIAKADIDILDWNDTKHVFTAKLISFAKMPEFTKLEFKILKKYKGNKRRTVTSYIKGHRTLHHIDTLFEGQEWIVFGNDEEIKGQNYFRLANPNAEHCGTSRPLLKDDHYIAYINNILQNKGLRDYTKDDKVYARGILNKGVPKKKWTYNIANNHFWEGKYKGGERSGIWYYKGLNNEGKLVTLERIKYKFGEIKSKHCYNYKGQLTSKEQYGLDKNTKDIYLRGQISKQVIQDLKTGKTTRLFYKNGKFVRREIK